MASLYEILFYSTICLLPAGITSGFLSALSSLGSLRAQEEIESGELFSSLFFFKSLHLEPLSENIVLALQLTKFFYYLLFSFVVFYFSFLTGTIDSENTTATFTGISFAIIPLIKIIFICLSIELITSLLCKRKPERALKVLSLGTSLFILPCLPFLYVYMKLKNLLRPKEQTLEKLKFPLKDKLFDYLTQSELGRYLDKTEIKLIHTTVSFKDRIVREVMVPRIDIFSLASDTSIKEAARYFSQEGYSRIPVFKENVDAIIGILLYKDFLSFYTQHVENNAPADNLNKTVEHLIKPVLYTPETKKISQLLQEFRNKQIHLAIVVDEYGGTEGIVTIEDILEELVGEIEDEHDTQEEKIYTPISSGGWIVDAKMSIIDLEEDLGIKIPHNNEYDTIGGFIFHRTGSIPNTGWKAHLDNVDLEILSSDARSIQKIKITPRRAEGS